MKKKKFFLCVCAMIMCICAFTACSDDDDNSGYYGTYATYGTYDNYTGKTFCDVIVITKNSFTTYNSSAVQDRSYWGSSSKELSGYKGWYVDGSSKRTYSYVKTGDRIVVENGSIFSIDGKSIVGGGCSYYKQN